MSTMAVPARTLALVYAGAVLTPLFWAVNFLIARAMRDEIPPFQMSFWRWTLAFVLLLPFAWPHLRVSGETLRRELWFLVFLGGIGVTAFHCLVYTALHHTTVINAALVNSLTPVMTFLLALILLRDRLSPRQMLGVVVSLAGAAVIIARGDIGGLLDLGVNHGDLLVVAAVVFWSAYTVLIKWRPSRLHPLAFLAATIGFGALLHLPLVAWEFHAVGGFAVTPATAASILYFAVFASILAYIFWNRAVAALGPGRTGMFTHLMPVYSAVLAVQFLGEPLLPYHLAGIVLIVAGITLVTRAKPVHKPAIT
jgi:drug/metabolite transporter (DMT)-like permease